MTIKKYALGLLIAAGSSAAIMAGPSLYEGFVLVLFTLLCVVIFDRGCRMMNEASNEQS